MNRGLAIGLVTLGMGASFAAGILVDRLLLTKKTPGPAVEAVPPSLISPDEGVVLPNGFQATNRRWDFRWSAVPQAEKYHIQVVTPTGSAWVEDYCEQPEFSYLHESVISESSRIGWSWRVRTQLGGKWSAWSASRTFNLQKSINTDYPSEEEVMAYLEGKTLDVPGKEPDLKQFVFQARNVEVLEVARARSSSGGEPWSSSVSFVLRQGMSRYAMEGRIRYTSIGDKKVFHGFTLNSVSKQ